MLDLAEIKSRINPAYAEWRGTESYERRQLCDEIERLQAVVQHEKDVAEAYKAEADALRNDAERLILLGEYKSEETGVVWFDKNPHAFVVGTKFYAKLKGR